MQWVFARLLQEDKRINFNKSLSYLRLIRKKIKKEIAQQSQMAKSLKREWSQANSYHDRLITLSKYLEEITLTSSKLANNGRIRLMAIKHLHRLLDPSNLAKEPIEERSSLGSWQKQLENRPSSSKLLKGSLRRSVSNLADNRVYWGNQVSLYHKLMKTKKFSSNNFIETLKRQSLHSPSAIFLDRLRNKSWSVSKRDEKEDEDPLHWENRTQQTFTYSFGFRQLWF